MQNASAGLLNFCIWYAFFDAVRHNLFSAAYNMRAAHTKSMHCIQDSMTAYNMRVPHTGCGSCIQYADNAFKIQGPHTICGHRILYAGPEF